MRMRCIHISMAMGMLTVSHLLGQVALAGSVCKLFAKRLVGECLHAGPPAPKACHIDEPLEAAQVESAWIVMVMVMVRLRLRVRVRARLTVRVRVRVRVSVSERSGQG